MFANRPANIDNYVSIYVYTGVQVNFLLLITAIESISSTRNRLESSRGRSADKWLRVNIENDVTLNDVNDITDLTMPFFTDFIR